MVNLSAGDLALEVDFGQNKPDAVLQKQDGDKWRDYLIDGKPVTNPFDVNALEPGQYRLRNP